MRPRLPEWGYLGVPTKHSAGRRPAVSPARVWRNGLLYSAQTRPAEAQQANLMPG